MVPCLPGLAGEIGASFEAFRGVRVRGYPFQTVHFGPLVPQPRDRLVGMHPLLGIGRIFSFA